MHPATHPKLHSQSFFDSLSLSLAFFHLHEQWPENKKYKSSHRTATLQSRHFCTKNFDEYFLSPAITNSKPGCALTLKQQRLPSNFKHKPVHQASTRLQVQRPQESVTQSTSINHKKFKRGKLRNRWLDRSCHGSDDMCLSSLINASTPGHL